MDRHLALSSRVRLSRPRSLKGLSIFVANQILRRRRDRGLPKLHTAGPQAYDTLAPRLRAVDAVDRGEQVPDRGELEADRGEQLAPSLLETIGGLGSRPRKQPLRQVMGQLFAVHCRTPAWLATQLRMEAGNRFDRHLTPMVRVDTLERR
ncbi:MAG: hypothetical protein QUV07_09830 [Cyanobium sp. CZS 25K]|nr:hypothetical protein [Cyanobium sp. CZS25K]